MAAALQSRIGNVPKGSLFAFLQSNGAGGFARTAFRMAGMWLLIAVLLAAVGKLLIDNGLVEVEVSATLERAWNHVTTSPSDVVSGARRNFVGFSAVWLWGIIWMVIWACIWM
jgi:hypothetical protein